jgi:hypothetical protein
MNSYDVNSLRELDLWQEIAKRTITTRMVTTTPRKRWLQDRGPVSWWRNLFSWLPSLDFIKYDYYNKRKVRCDQSSCPLYFLSELASPRLQIKNELEKRSTIVS